VLPIEKKRKNGRNRSKLFFWYYAIIEILKQNPNYSPYSNELATLTIFNLAEFYYSALVDYGEEKADEIYLQYKQAVVDINDETLKNAIKFSISKNI